MSFCLDKSSFQKFADEIAELANIYFESTKYENFHIEVHLVLVDYQDGIGSRMCSRALVRNHTELAYDLVKDVLGPPEMALQELLAFLVEAVRETYPDKYKAKLSKMN